MFLRSCRCFPLSFLIFGFLSILKSVDASSHPILPHRFVPSEDFFRQCLKGRRKRRNRINGRAFPSRMNGMEWNDSRQLGADPVLPRCTSQRRVPNLCELVRRDRFESLMAINRRCFPSVCMHAWKDHREKHCQDHPQTHRTCQ